jgi:hypothetical protein
MKKKSLQEIEDLYKNQGCRGDKLRKILAKDKEWIKLYKERQQRLNKSFPLTKTEQKYVMSTNEDYEILRKVKQLEKLKLTREEKFLVFLIKTQLEFGWRKYLIQTLNKILRKHKTPRDWLDLIQAGGRWLINIFKYIIA